MRLHQTAAPLAKVWAPKAAVLLSGHNETGFQRRFLASSKNRATDWQCRRGASAAAPAAAGPSGEAPIINLSPGGLGRRQVGRAGRVERCRVWTGS